MARYAFVSTKAIHTVKVCENWALPKPRTRGDILKKSTDFHVRISNDELELIDEKAHRLRMTRSKYVIQAALHQKVGFAVIQCRYYFTHSHYPFIENAM